MAEKTVRVAILRKMNNLENDDRLRKEVGTLSVLFPNVVFKCFVMYPENKEFEGETSYGLPFKSVCVKGRDRYTSGKHLLAKSWDYYCAIKKDIKDFDVVWCSGDAPTPSLLFIYGKTLIWDLRELPLFLMGSRAKHSILKFIFKRCSVCLHANQFRIDHLTQMGLIKEPSKHFPIRNLTDFSSIDPEYDKRYYEVKNWISDRKCIYLQGINAPSRASEEVLSAVMETHDVCAIVLGNVDKDAIDLIEKKYGKDEVALKICFAGSFPVLKVPQYMKLCQATMVFYKNTSINNWYCEANRLYQAVDVGLPAVVGANPPMKAIVEDLGVGISVDTDGSDVTKMAQGLSSLLSCYNKYKKNIGKLQNEIKWDSQTFILKGSFEKILNK